MYAFWEATKSILFVVVGYGLYRLWEQYRRKRKEFEEQRRQKRESVLQSHLPKLTGAVDDFNTYLDAETGYFANHQLTTWRERHFTLFKEINSRPFNGIVNPEGLTILNTFKDYFANCENYRSQFNSEFIRHERHMFKNLFDNIENRALDEQQRTAIVTDEDNNLVIAGAGSGKTTTIVGKVQYILDKYKIRPEEILLISFTRKSAGTLSLRLKIGGVEAKTFHKFGKDVVATVDGKQPLIFDEKQFRQFVINTFSTLIKDEYYLHKVTEYFTDLIKPERSQFEFEKQGDYIQYLKDQDYRPYQQIQPEGKLSFQREIVKSIEECKIANFLLFHNLSYKYELPYERDTATPLKSRWRPDFTVTQNGKTVYIEHFGVKRNGDVPSFFAKNSEPYQIAKDRYWKKIEFAREQSRKDGTILIETFSYEMDEGILYTNLKANLEAHGIILKLKPPEEIWKNVVDASRDEVGNFITLLQTFITLMKSNNYAIDDLSAKNSTLYKGFQAKRNAAFLKIVDPIFKSYEDHLRARGEIDFSDMINKASEYIRNGQFDRKFSYVVVDEFQDISIGRYQLLKAIKDTNPSCKFFCVGDDWQSIYRFSGSDISLFKDFEKYFGHTAKCKIETTYRFHNPILKLTSEFIQRNPNQTRKQLRSLSRSKSTQHEIVYSNSETPDQDDTDALKGVLDNLARTTTDVESKEIILLGRYNNDINRIKNSNHMFDIRRGEETSVISYNTRIAGKAVKLLLQFLTVHKAKGLEADIVIVLNCNSGKFGFPSEMSDDPVLNLILSEADQFENGEERRLFYVAMTRAKERTYLIADSVYKSKFITELEVGGGSNQKIEKCPVCATADLVKRSGIKNDKPWALLQCSNWQYGCDYKEWLTWASPTGAAS